MADEVDRVGDGALIPAGAVPETGGAPQGVGSMIQKGKKGFQKGGRGYGRGGRVTGSIRLTPILLRELEKFEEVRGERMRVGEALVKRWIKFARRGKQGDAAYLREIVTRTDGVAPQTVHVTGELKGVCVNLHHFDYERLAAALRGVEGTGELRVPLLEQGVVEGNVTE